MMIILMLTVNIMYFAAKAFAHFTHYAIETYEISRILPFSSVMISYFLP